MGKSRPKFFYDDYGSDYDYRRKKKGRKNRKMKRHIKERNLDYVSPDPMEEDEDSRTYYSEIK